jgi:hypothetical protein
LLFTRLTATAAFFLAPRLLSLQPLAQPLQIPPQRQNEEEQKEHPEHRDEPGYRAYEFEEFELLSLHAYLLPAAVFIGLEKAVHPAKRLRNCRKFGISPARDFARAAQSDDARERNRSTRPGKWL